MTSALWLSLAVDVQHPPSEEQHSLRVEDHYLDLRVSPGWQALEGVGRWRWTLQNRWRWTAKYVLCSPEVIPVLCWLRTFQWCWGDLIDVSYDLYSVWTINFAAWQDGSMTCEPASCQVEVPMWVVVAMHYGLILLVLMWIKVLFLHIHNMTDTMRHETWLFWRKLERPTSRLVTRKGGEVLEVSPKSP